MPDPMDFRCCLLDLALNTRTRFQVCSGVKMCRIIYDEADECCTNQNVVIN